LIMISPTMTADGTAAAIFGALGVSGSAGTGSSVSIYGADAAATSATDRKQSATIYTRITTGGTIIKNFSLTSYDADGFTLNHTVASAFAEIIGYIAIKGPSVKSSSITQKTSTGSQAYTGVGFKPGLLLLRSVSTTGTTATTSALITYGAASGASNEAGVAFVDVNAQATTSSDTRSNSAAILTNIGGTAPTLQAEADLTSFDADGFTFNYTTADATARVYYYMALEEGTGGGKKTNRTVIF